MIAIVATPRTETGNALAAIRAAGNMPAVVYGPKQEPLSITVNQRDFAKVFKSAGESTVVTVSIDGREIPALIHDIDRDPVTGAIRHADLYAIVKGQKVQVMIPLSFIGDSGAVKAGANLVKTLHELEVEADPMHLPHELSVDLAQLRELGDQVVARDIVLPSGVTLVTDPDEIVAIAAQANEEVAAEAPTSVDMSQIGDSVERGKKEEEETSA